MKQAETTKNDQKRAETSKKRVETNKNPEKPDASFWKYHYTLFYRKDSYAPILVLDFLKIFDKF